MVWIPDRVLLGCTSIAWIPSYSTALTAHLDDKAQREMLLETSSCTNTVDKVDGSPLFTTGDWIMGMDEKEDSM